MRGILLLALIAAGCGENAPAPARAPAPKSEAPAPEPARTQDAAPPTSPVAQWRILLRSGDYTVRRNARDAMELAGHPALDRIRTLLSALRRGLPDRVLPALAEHPELTRLLLADRIGYMSLLMRTQVVGELAGANRNDDWAIGVLCVHTLLDPNERVCHTASRSLAAVSPDVSQLLTTAGEVRYLHTGRLARWLSTLPHGTQILEAIAGYLPVFASRLGADDLILAMQLTVDATAVAATKTLSAEDEQRLRLLWDRFRQAGSLDGEWHAGDRSEVAERVGEALSGNDPERLRELLASDRTRELALPLMLLRNVPLKGLEAEITQALVRGADAAVTLLIVERSGLDRDALAKQLRAIVLDEDREPLRRLGAARQLTTFSRLGPAQDVLVAFLKDDKLRHSALTTLALCHPEDRDGMRDAVASTLRLRRSHRKRLQWLDESPERRRERILHRWVSSLPEFLDRWAVTRLVSDATRDK